MTPEKLEPILTKLLEGLAQEKTRIGDIFSSKDTAKLVQFLEVQENDLNLILDCLLYYIEK